MLRPAATALLLLAAPANAADSVKIWPGYIDMLPSTAELHAPTDPAATATLTFSNTAVHSKSEVFALTYEGITVTIHFTWQKDGRSAESMVVDAPDGYVAVPREIIVPEGQTQQVQIIKWSGM